MLCVGFWDEDVSYLEELQCLILPHFRILIKNYLLDSETGRARSDAFFNTTASNDFGNGDLTYADLALLNAEKIDRKSTRLNSITQ